MNRIITPIFKNNLDLGFQISGSAAGREFADNFLPHCGAFSHVFIPPPGINTYFKNLSKTRGWPGGGHAWI